MNDPRFVIYLDEAKEYRWRFRAGNGEIIADSAEGYVSKSSCKDAIKLIKREAPDADIVDLTT